jgi:PAS domain S-box-containing protein
MRILLVEANRPPRRKILTSLARELPEARLEPVDDESVLAERLASGEFDAVVAGRSRGWGDRRAVLRSVRERWPGRVVVWLMAPSEERAALCALRDGLDDYVVRTGPEIARLASVLRRCRERRQAEPGGAPLLPGGELFRELIERSSDLFLELDGERRILYASPSATRLLGHESEALGGRDVLDFVVAEDRDTVAAAFDRAASDPRSGEEVVEHRVVGRDGCPRWLEARGTPVRDPSGSVRFVVDARDVTERRAAEEALGASEQRFRRLAEHSPNMIFINQRGRVVYANPRCEEVLGYPREELLAPGFDFRSLVGEESRRLVEDNFRRHLGGEELEPYEYTLLARDGRRVEGIHTTRLIDYGDGKAILGIVTDITERKRAETALRNSEERFHALFDTIQEGFALHEMLYDEEGRPCDYRFLEANPAFGRLTGLDPAAILGRRVLEVLPDLEPAWIERYGEVARTGRAVRFEQRSALGKRYEVLAYRPHEGQFAAIFTDVTDRKTVEEEHARLSRAVESAAESIVITDPDGTIVYVNPAFERISGYSRAEALGRNPRILKSGAHDTAFYAALWAKLGRGEVWEGRIVNRRKDGTQYEEEAAISPVRDENGRLVNYVAVKRDVTRERRLEQQLLQSQKMEAVGRLAGGVAHDFNNLLGVIVGYGELLLKRLPEEDRNRSGLEQLLKAAERASSLTRQLLAFSRRQILQPRVLDLNVVVSDMERMLKRLIGEDIDLVTHLDSELACVKADPGQLEQVIMNLAVNARDSMPGGGRLTVETRNVELGPADHTMVEAGRYVLVAITDTGCGIDTAALPHVFEPFFTTKELGKGTGLGLSTVYGIVKQSGGYVWAYSEVGRGATFKVYLPAVAARSSPRDEAPVSRPTPGTETVLVVEDEAMLRGLLRDALEGGGYTVLDAPSGEEALRRAEEHAGPIDLLLTDVVMPGMSGPAVAERVATLRPRIRVLYMSGYPDSAIVRHGVLQQGMEFLGKPFAPDVLLQRVRTILDTPA